MTKPLGYPIEPGWRLILKDLGVEERVVLRRAALPEDLLSRTGTVLRTNDYFRLWEALEAEVGDPLFPIRFNDVMKTEHFIPSLFAAMCSPDLLTAVNRIGRYKLLRPSCRPLKWAPWWALTAAAHTRCSSLPPGRQVLPHPGSHP